MNITVTISKFNIFQIVWGLALAITALLANYNFPNLHEDFVYWIRMTANMCLINCLLLLWLAGYNLMLKIKKKPTERSPLNALLFIAGNFIYIIFAAGILTPILVY